MMPRGRHRSAFDLLAGQAFHFPLARFTFGQMPGPSLFLRLIEALFKRQPLQFEIAGDGVL